MNTETRCHWHYTHPAWGRVMTQEPFTEGDALRLLPDAERVEGSEVFLPAPRIGHALASGLVRRVDGAMMPPEGMNCVSATERQRKPRKRKRVSG